MTKDVDAKTLFDEMVKFADERMDKAFNAERTTFTYMMAWEAVALLLLVSLNVAPYFPQATPWVTGISVALLLGVSISHYRRMGSGDVIGMAKHDYFAYRYALMLIDSLVHGVNEARFIGDKEM